MEIIAVDDDPILLHTIKMVLEKDFGEVTTLQHPNQLENQLSKNMSMVIILDLNFAIGTSDGAEGLAWISRIKDQWDHISIVVLTAHGFVDVAVRSLKLGATDFVEKPFVNEKLIATVKAAHTLALSKRQLKNILSEKDVLVNQLNRSEKYVAGTSLAMQKIHELVLKVANTEASILITGEHGTGKEVIARLIHLESARVANPFIHVDMGAITDSLFESTLFGHAKGSFTDAREDKPGLLEMANFGTLFLDEIGELPLHLQSKLLSVLQNQEVTRIGEHVPRALDLRVITATHFSVNHLTEEKQFRQDLFFRINTVTIEIPPLRDRTEDIKPLVAHFLKYFNQKYTKNSQLSKKEMNKMEEHSWPGNVRELKNTIERMVIMENCGESQLDIRDFTVRESDNLYELEKEKIAELITRHSGNISRAAQELGIGRNTLYRKMKKYGI
ncbi:MAG: sigma-54 dependent transcriptional regulator [Cyclobacteriaceae bacterium]